MTYFCYKNGLASLWQMEFNPSKCKHLTVTNSHSFIQSIYKICDQPIKKVPCAKYLDVIFDQYLSWKDHNYKPYSYICGKANVIKVYTFAKKSSPFPKTCKVKLL